MTTLPDSSSAAVSVKASLPMRLCDFHVAPDGRTLAYGGDEVDLSIWDIERTLSAQKETDGNNPSNSKRKKPGDNQLLPAELWRAKNVRTPNSLELLIHFL
jgi:ribosome biogenesis protein NSA1